MMLSFVNTVVQSCKPVFKDTIIQRYKDSKIQLYNITI